MSQEEDKTIIRNALFLAYERKCFYCAQLVAYRNLHIDHYIPESCSKIEIDRYIQNFGLSLNFTVLDLSNLVPACAGCNMTKSDKTAHLKMPIASIQIANIQKKLPLVNKLISKWIDDLKIRAPKNPYLGHFVKHDSSAEIFVLSSNLNYIVTVRHQNGVSFQFQTDFAGGNAEFSDSPILDDLNDTQFTPYFASLTHLENGISVTDLYGAYGHLYPEAPMFSGLYRRTAYTHSVLPKPK